MKLITPILFTVLPIVYGRPQLSASEIEKTLSRDFGTSKDRQNIDLPPIQNTLENTNYHPFNFKLNNDGSGNYDFRYNDIDGTGRSEIGELKNAGTDNEIQTVRGQYIDKYFTSDGKIILRTIGYTADENGYRPFLINISVQQGTGGFGVGPPPVAPIVPSRPFSSPAAPPAPGAPKGQKGGISSAALGSLIGGGGVAGK